MPTTVELYSRACHGDGADARWEARDAIVALAEKEGRTVVEQLRWYGLNVAAYFASRPIGRTARCKAAMED